MRRLYPDVDKAAGGAADVDLAELYGGERPRPAHRPWVGLCMIASLDGSTATDRRSGGLGNSSDRAVFAALRSAADVILVGAATVAAEQYQPPRKPGQRIGVVTGSGHVDTGTDLFRSGAGFLVMPESETPAPAGTDVVRAGRGRLDLAAALARLGDVTDTPAFVQAEGGATLNAALLDAGCVDELNLSIAPLLAGGDGRRLVSGAAPTRVGLDLAHLLIDDEGYLFSRWLRRPDGTTVARRAP